jgi:hypothetical protein
VEYLVRLGAALLGLLPVLAVALVVRPPPALVRPLLAIAAAGAATRTLLPDVLLHIQNDDVALVAAARTGDLSLLPPSHSGHGTLLPLLGFGDIDGAFLVARFFSAGLPALGLLLAWAWLADRRLATVVGVLLLLSPPALIYSGGITAYLPAACAFTAAVTLGIVPRGLAARAGATAVLLFAALLKPEFLLLVPAHAALCVAHSRAPGRVFEAIPAVLVAVAIAIGTPEYLVDFLSASRKVENATPGFLTSKIIDYLAVGLLLLIPPFLPLKVAFLKGLRDRRMRPLQAFTFAFAGLFVLSHSSWNLNQWRHALLYLVPLLIAASPVVLDWWDKRAVSRSARGWLVLLVVFNLVGFARYSRVAGDPRQAALEALRGADLPPGSLVLYAAHGQDLDPRTTLRAATDLPILPLSELVPDCPAGAEFDRITRRARDVDTRRKGGDPAVEPIGPGDPAACREQLVAARELWTQHPAVALFVDHAPAMQRNPLIEALQRLSPRVPVAAEHHREEALLLAAELLGLDGIDPFTPAVHRSSGLVYAGGPVSWRP